MADFDRRYMVKQYLTKIRGKFCEFMVFSTGESGWLLFCALDKYGCQGGLQIPVRRKDLKREVSRMIPRAA